MFLWAGKVCTFTVILGAVVGLNSVMASIATVILSLNVTAPAASCTVVGRWPYRSPIDLGIM